MDLLVNVDKFDAFNSELARCESMLSSVRSTLTNVQSRINSRFLRDCGIYGQMGTISSRLTKEKNAVGRMRTAIDSIEHSYRSMENKNIRACHTMSLSSAADVGVGAVTGGTSAATTTQETDSFKWWEWKDTWSMVEQFGLVGSLISTIGGAVTGGISTVGDWLGITKDGVGFIGDLAESFSNSKFDWKTLFGFDSKALKDMTWGKYFDDLADDLNFGNATKVTDKISVATKWAGYVLSFGAEIYENFTEENNSFGRSLLEGIVEGGVGIGLSTLAAAGVSVGLAAVGVASAPAVVVGAIGAGVVWAVDSVVEYFSGKDIGEHVSDFVSDTVEKKIENVKKVGKAIGDGAKAVYDYITGWWN